MQNAIVHMTHYMLRKNKWSNKDCGGCSKILYNVFSLNLLPSNPSDSSTCLTMNLSTIKQQAIQIQKHMVFQARNAGLYHNLVFFRIALKYLKNISTCLSEDFFSHL